MKKESVTITKIAKESGVSISTVSRVLNGNVPVSSDKKERVEKVVAKYHFTPNSLAQSLVRKETKTLGIIIPDISNPYFSSIFLELERYANEAGYSLFLCNTLFGGSGHGINKIQKESAFFKLMIEKGVDGVLIFGGQVDMNEVDNEYRESLNNLSEHVPVVVIGKYIENTNCSFIQNENGFGVKLAINHLHALGHRKIAFIGGQEGVTITDIRLSAYREACKDLGLGYNDRLVLLTDYYIEAGYEAILRLNESKEEYTALIAINDNVALGAIRALSDFGRSVPEDVAVISCEQFPNAEYHVPRLTSINLHSEILARISINTLLNQIKDMGLPTAMTIRPELIIRESC